MPASSRKRNKGKERKAKKEENMRVTAHEFWSGFCINTGCNHGHALVISDDHPVSNFMDQFYINLHCDFTSLRQHLGKIFKSHTQIWNAESYRKLVIDILIRIGTNLLLKDEEIDENPFMTTYGGTLIIAQSIMVLEHFDDANDIDSVIDKRLVISKWRDINDVSGSTKRDLLKFFRKRTSCKCLKKLHLEARKKEPKMGECWYCEEKSKRTLLCVCSRCRIYQYCSRECQVADWDNHKEVCDGYSHRTAEV